jgi:DNA-binding MarR family transcriptional regulator
MTDSSSKLEEFGYEAFSRFYRHMISIELECREFLERVGYTSAEINLIRMLSRYPGITLKRLAETMGVTTQAISSTVKRFVEADIVDQLPHPDDGRKKCLHIGEGFDTHATALQEIYVRHIGIVMDNVDEADIQAFTRVTDALENQPVRPKVRAA